MAFEYVDGYPTGLQGLQYNQPQQQQQSQQQSGISPMSLMGIGKQFMGGGAGDGSAGAGGAGAVEAGTGAVAGGGGAAGGMGSMAASAGPWAALAAIIAVNEHNAIGGGYRSDDPEKYREDLMSGEVVSQDFSKRWLPKIGLEEGSKANKIGTFIAQPVSGDLGESWESFKELF